MRWLAMLWLLLASCQFDGAGLDNDLTPDAAIPPTPDADVPPPDAPADTPDADPSCVPACVGMNQLDDCSGSIRDCLFGCEDTAGPRCRELDPSNGVAKVHLSGVTSPLIVPAGAYYEIDTDTGEIIDGLGAVIRPAGTGVLAGIAYHQPSATMAILGVTGLTVGPGATLFATGVRAIALLSAGNVNINGVVDVSAFCPPSGATRVCAGPGGGDGSTAADYAQGCAAGEDGLSGSGPETGGGGGGLGASGAAGGTSDDPGGAGGMVTGTCTGANIEPLMGGSGGGQGGSNDAISGGEGGGGGGALQISSYTRIAIVDTVSGGPIVGVRSSGGGGRGGGAGDGGGGGGSGGAILLEAPEVELAGITLAANGGGGGQGGGTGNGTVGLFSAAFAPGGGVGTGGGGHGGVEGNPAEAGVASIGFDGTGGGGGGVGLIRINVVASGFSSSGVVASPAVSVGTPDSI